MKKLVLALLALTLIGKAQNTKVNDEKHVVVLSKAPIKQENFNKEAVFNNHTAYIDNLIKTNQIISSGGFEGIEKYSGMYILKESDLVKAKNLMMKDPGYGKLFEMEFFVWHGKVKE